MHFLTAIKNIFHKSSLEDVSDHLFYGRQWKNLFILERLGIILIALSPTFYLGVKSWITNVSILAVLVVVIHLFQVRAKLNLKQIPFIKAIALVFIIYTAAIIISQMGRFAFTYKPYLDQSRWLIGLPIFIFLYYVRINFAKILDWVAPVCIFVAYVSSVHLNPSDAWGGRATVSHIDPLAFGFLNLSLGLTCFASAAVDVYKKNYSINTVIKLLAFALGVYLSIRSGSRTGWAALPVVIILMFYILYRPKIWKGVVFFLLTSAAVFALYQASYIVKARVDVLLLELLQYPWQGGVAPDNSVSLRITFHRLGYYYFSQSPLFGWGERGYASIKDAAELMSFSSQYARDFAFGALFHSEWLTQSVRFGIMGLLGVFWVFFLPMRLFVGFIKSGNEYLKVACMGLAYLICQLAASLSDEVFNSKGMITLSAIIIAGLLATGLSLLRRKHEGV
jgi:O-antigen ligase